MPERRSWARLRVRRATAALAAIALTAGGILVIGAQSAIAAPPTGGSAIVGETFQGASVVDASWTVQGDTCLTGASGSPTPGAALVPDCSTHRTGPVPPVGTTPGYLQLTDQGGNRAGSILYNRPVPASAGVSITFEQYQYGGNGADGIGFFLVDGSTSLTSTGGLGGSLGYAQRNTEPGVVGGFLGVGLDAYGNFWDDGENRGAGCPVGQRSPTTASGPIAPNVISLRGPGAGTNGYCLLGATVPQPVTNPQHPGTTLNGGQGTLRSTTLAASKRTVNIVVDPVTTTDPNPHVIVQVQYVDGGPWVQELDIPAPPNIPSTYKFGLSASTGGSNDVHLIRAAVISTRLPLQGLQLEKQIDRTGAALPAIISAGSVIPYQYTVTNVGDPVTDLAITDDRIATTAIACDSTSLTTAPAPGSSTVCRGRYTVTTQDVALGSITNVAAATALVGGLEERSPDATVMLPLVSRLQIAKVALTPGPYSVGQRVDYRYTLTNAGGTTLTTFQVSDDRMPSSSIVCNDGTLDSGAATTCTGGHLIQPGQLNPAGFLINTASAVAKTTFGQSVASGTATASIPVSTDVGVTKTVDVPNPLVGTDVNFTITAVNNGPSVATGVIITDVVPDGDPVGSVVYASSTPASGTTYDPTTGAWRIPSLAVGQSLTLGIRATVNTGNPFTNNATVTSTAQPDRDPTNNSSSVTLNPVTPTTDLGVTKTVDRPVIVIGDSALFTVRVQNNGPFAATGVAVGDQIPAGLTYDVAGSSGDGSYDESTGLWSIGSLAVDAIATRVFAVSGVLPGTYTNLASITGTPSPVDTNPSNNSDSATLTVRAPVADLTVVKTPFPQSGVIGDIVTYQLSATNLGPDVAPGVVVTDVWPGGVQVGTASASVGTITADGTLWTVGALAPGQSVTATVTATLTAAGTQVNTATVTSPVVIDPDPSNNSSSGTVTSGEPELDIAVTKNVRILRGAPITEVPVGETVEFAITAHNTPASGATTATDLVFGDLLPAGLGYVSSSGDGSYDPVAGVWTVTSIPANGTATLLVRATVDRRGSWTNTVSLVSLTQVDIDPTNNSATANVTGVLRADLAISKSVAPGVAQPGDTVAYTVTVSNNGPNAASNVEAFDPAIIDAVIAGTTVPAGTTFDANSRVWLIPSLAAGASLDLEVRVSIQRGGWYRNFVVVNSETPDLFPDDNIDFADLFVPLADIAVTKTVDRPAALVGDLLTFTIGVSDLGPDPAEGVTVDDPLPAGLTLISATASRGSYDAQTGRWSVGDLDPVNLPAPPIGQEQLTIVARAQTPGSATNVAVSDRTGAFPFDPVSENNAAQATVRVDPLTAQLTLTKEASSTSVAAGSGLTYRMVVSNLGPAVASAVTLSDPVPASLEPKAVRGQGCAITGLLVECAIGDLAVGASVTVELDVIVSGSGSIANVARVTTTTPTKDPGPTTATATVTARPPIRPPTPQPNPSPGGLAHSGTDVWIPGSLGGGALVGGLLLLTIASRRRRSA